MNAKEFFAEVCKLRKYQKRYDKYGDRDKLNADAMRRQENLIDTEIKRVEAVLKEQAQPRFFDI